MFRNRIREGFLCDFRHRKRFQNPPRNLSKPCKHIIQSTTQRVFDETRFKRSLFNGGSCAVILTRSFHFLVQIMAAIAWWHKDKFPLLVCSKSNCVRAINGGETAEDVCESLYENVWYHCILLYFDQGRC